jgi:hypothetical protein
MNKNKTSLRKLRLGCGVENSKSLRLGEERIEIKLLLIALISAVF